MVEHICRLDRLVTPVRSYILGRQYSPDRLYRLDRSARLIRPERSVGLGNRWPWHVKYIKVLNGINPPSSYMKMF